MAATSYYTPYESDSDSDTDSTTSSGSINNIVNFRALAESLAAGPNLDVSGQILFNKHAAGTVAGYALTTGFPTFSNYEIPVDPSGNQLNTNKEKLPLQPMTNVIMLASNNRDKGVYPQPTSLTLRLPKTYSRVTNFQIVQIKLLSSFFYFRNDKHNTDISILESGRTVANAAGIIIPDIVTNYIREGTYDINSLLTELTTQLNYTPIFYDYPAGFEEFAPRFAATGDYSLNFNYPGDTFYDTNLNQYVPNPTMAYIIGKYFQTQYAGLSSYSTDQLKMAYYYPVLKEYLLDATYLADFPLNLDTVVFINFLLQGETVESRCIYTFQGLNDPVVLGVINNNITLLNTYRVNHTFRYFLVNKYVLSYETNSNRITFSSPSLNTSLLNLLNFKYNQFFAEQLSIYNITQAQYNTYNTQNTISLAVLNSMFYYIQKYLAIYFGIGFNSFSLDYIAHPVNLLPIRDAYQATGISSNFDVNVLTGNVIPISNDILSPLRVDPPRFWNRLTNLPQTTYPLPLNLETGDPTTSSNYPYSILLDKQDRLHSMVNPVTNYIYVNRLTRYADILVPIQPTQYTVFKFRSPVRQTLEVQTLPRPTQYRYPAYNTLAATQGIYDASHVALFDNSYCFIQNAQNAAMDVTADFATSNLMSIPGFSNQNTTTNFGVNYQSSINLWNNDGDSIYVGNTRVFYTFYAPYPTDYLTNVAPAYRYPMSLTLTHEPKGGPPLFLAALRMYLYHDRGAFMADVSANRMESSYNYISSCAVSTNASTITFTFNAYANQRYYVMARSETTTPTTENFFITPWFPSGTSYTALTSTLTGFNPYANPQSATALSNYNYATLADPAYIKLPIQAAIQTTPVLQSNDVALTFSTVAMGYDIDGVSTDLTHYIPYIQSNINSNVYPPSPVHIDPITGYIYQSDKGYSKTYESYQYPASGNTLLSPTGAQIYTPKKITARQYSIVHYYTNTYIPNSENQAPMLSSQMVSPTYISPLTATSAGGLTGYQYGGSNQAIQLGDGVMGVSFIPSQGVWDIDRIMFKSVYTTASADENRGIQYIGIYFAASVHNKFTYDIKLSNAIAVLKLNSTITYNASYSNFGFDAVGGTYYEYTRDTSYLTGSPSYLCGYSQNVSTFNNDINSLYTCVPFDAQSNVTTYRGLAGSLVPYPYYSDASGALAYYDGTSPVTATSIVVPVVKASPDINRGPPTGYTQTQSAYEQSMPIGTTLLQYIVPYSFVSKQNAFQPWNPLPYAPSKVVADVSGFMLTQDNFYRVFKFDTNTTTRSFHESYRFTLDQVFPPQSNVNFIGLAANESSYAFFAYSNASPYGSLLINVMNPATGVVENRATYPIEYDLNTYQVTNLTYNNFGGYTLALKNTGGIEAFCQHTSTLNPYTIYTESGAHDTDINRFITLQSPKEQYGRFYVANYRTSIDGVNDYSYIDPSVYIVQDNPNYSYTATTYTRIPGFLPGILGTPTISVFSLPATYRSPTVTRQPYKDNLFFTAASAPTSFFQITGFTASNTSAYTSTAVLSQSVYSFPSNISTLYPGANGGLWTNIGDVMYGNRNDSADAPRTSGQAWQMFYPAQRIVFKQVAKNFTFMNDLSGLNYAEYPHTALIAYNSRSKLLTDTSGQWGLESSSNFTVADFAFSGNYFNSRVFTVPLKPNTDYYLAVRGYSPTEKSQVMMRFNLTNRYDFGYTGLGDISDEIVMISTMNTSKFAPDYAASLQNFNSNFIFGSNGITFGAGVIPGYGGTLLSSITGFPDFYGRFIGFYNTYNTNVQVINAINNASSSNLTTFIQTDLRYILPPTALNRQRYTDPLIYTILWKSSLIPQYASLEQEWGLGWNLGFAKADTSYQTVQRADSFFKILDDYIYLRLNPEYDMNRMDMGGKENLSATMEPTGETKAYHAKLLLASFGNYAQTLVSNPLSFSPPLGRMDKLTFQLIDKTGTVINNADCEWDVMIQLTEEKPAAMIPIPIHLDPTARIQSVKKDIR